MKKYFSYFFVMILSCTVLFTTSCSDDDDHPYQRVIDDSDSRVTFGDIDFEPSDPSWLHTYNNETSVYGGNSEASVHISYIGDSKTGVKQEPTVTIWDGSQNVTYKKDQISKLEVVKVEEPKSFEEPGKIWIVAVIKDKETGEEKELVFVNDYRVEGGQDQ